MLLKVRTRILLVRRKSSKGSQSCCRGWGIVRTVSSTMCHISSSPTPHWSNSGQRQHHMVACQSNGVSCTLPSVLGVAPTASGRGTLWHDCIFYFPPPATLLRTNIRPLALCLRYIGQLWIKTYKRSLFHNQWKHVVCPLVQWLFPVRSLHVAVTEPVPEIASLSRFFA